MLGPKRQEVIGKWRKLHTYDLYSLFSSPNIRRINSRTMRGAEHVRAWEGR
jgi:hypothetical protein